jgi:hypothetical protein
MPGINLIVKQHKVYFTSSRLMPGHAWLWDAYSVHVLSFALPIALRHSLSRRLAVLVSVVPRTIRLTRVGVRTVLITDHRVVVRSTIGGCVRARTAASTQHASKVANDARFRSFNHQCENEKERLQIFGHYYHGSLKIVEKQAIGKTKQPQQMNRVVNNILGYHYKILQFVSKSSRRSFMATGLNSTTGHTRVIHTEF